MPTTQAQVKALFHKLSQLPSRRSDSKLVREYHTKWLDYINDATLLADRYYVDDGHPTVFATQSINGVNVCCYRWEPMGCTLEHQHDWVGNVPPLATSEFDLAAYADAFHRSVSVSSTTTGDASGISNGSSGRFEVLSSERPASAPPRSAMSSASNGINHSVDSPSLLPEQRRRASTDASNSMLSAHKSLRSTGDRATKDFGENLTATPPDVGTSSADVGKRGSAEPSVSAAIGMADLALMSSATPALPPHSASSPLSSTSDNSPSDASFPVHPTVSDHPVILASDNWRQIDWSKPRGALFFIHGITVHARFSLLRLRELHKTVGLDDVEDITPAEKDALVEAARNGNIDQDAFDRSWLSEGLEQGYVVYAIDLQGHGLSSAWEGCRANVDEFECYCSDVLQFLQGFVRHGEILPSTRVFLAGWSLGGTVATRLCEIGFRRGDLILATSPAGKVAEPMLCSSPPHVINPKLSWNNAYIREKRRHSESSLVQANSILLPPDVVDASIFGARYDRLMDGGQPRGYPEAKRFALNQNEQAASLQREADHSPTQNNSQGREFLTVRHHKERFDYRPSSVEEDDKMILHTPREYWTASEESVCQIEPNSDSRDPQLEATPRDRASRFPRVSRDWLLANERQKSFQQQQQTLAGWLMSWLMKPQNDENVSRSKKADQEKRKEGEEEDEETDLFERVFTTDPEGLTPATVCSSSYSGRLGSGSDSYSPEHVQPPVPIAGLILIAPALSAERLKRKAINRILLPMTPIVSDFSPTFKAGLLEPSYMFPYIDEVRRQDSLCYWGLMTARICWETLCAIDQAVAESNYLPAGLPLFLIHSLNDTMTDPEGSRRFVEVVQSYDKEACFPTTGWHFLSKEPGCRQRILTILNWMNCHAK